MQKGVMQSLRNALPFVKSVIRRRPDYNSPSPSNTALHDTTMRVADVIVAKLPKLTKTEQIEPDGKYNMDAGIEGMNVVIQ